MNLFDWSEGGPGKRDRGATWSEGGELEEVLGCRPPDLQAAHPPPAPNYQQLHNKVIGGWRIQQQ